MTTTITTCTRKVAALLHDGSREMRPCRLDLGHDGVCEYDPPTTEPVCPAWCSGHNDTGWQSWEEASTPEEARLSRTHASQRGEVAGRVGVELLTEETFPSREMTPPLVTLYTANDSEDLTPAQARQVAAALLEAADEIEAATA